ncbi:MAG: hypothetical protein V4773_29760 [Verrucomicrobiota bacterium]
MPLLALKDGKYIVTGQSRAEGATVVTSVSRTDEKKINRDLCDQIGLKSDHAWFQVLEEKDGVTHVSLEAPTEGDSKRKGWYSLHRGEITLERIVYYGPGFAFLVLPWSIAAGVLGLVLYKIIAHRLKRQSKSPELMSGRGSVLT